jgi:hypothetical protein
MRQVGRPDGTGVLLRLGCTEAQKCLALQEITLQVIGMRQVGRPDGTGRSSNLTIYSFFFLNLMALRGRNSHLSNTITNKMLLLFSEAFAD